MPYVGLISEAHQAIIRLSPSLWITSVRALINLTDNLAIRRDKTGQHSLRRATDAINHVTAHCSRLVAQIVCCAAHRTAFFSVLPGKPVALLTCRSTNQLALCAWLLVRSHLKTPGLKELLELQPAISSAAPTIPAKYFTCMLFPIINELDATRVVRV